MKRNNCILIANRNRRGNAPLEFVLAMPFLCLVAACIFAAGNSCLNRTKAAHQARLEVWQQRDPAKTQNLASLEKTDSKPLFIANSETAGEAFGKAESNYKVYDFLGGDKTAESRAAILVGTWDHREIKEFTDSPGIPHIATAGRVAGMDQGLIDTINTVIELIFLTRDSELPNQDDIDDAEDGKNAAEEEAEKRRKEMEDKIAELKEELAQLKIERDQLIAERNQLEADIDTAEAELDVLKDANPVDAAAVAAKEAEIDSLEDQVKVKNDEIKAKNDEIKAKEEEIKEWEDALDTADEEIGEIGE